MTYRFTIPGNESDLKGNPRPKIKKTNAQQWSPEAQRYQAWKDHVQKMWYDTLKHLGLPRDIKRIKRDAMKVVRAPGRYNKPIDVKKARMDLMIHFRDEKHADPESVFGSIADALFVEDNHLAFAVDYDHTPGIGSVDVKITIPE